MSTTELPEAIVIILHGDDEAAIKEINARFYAGLGDPAAADMNTTQLDGGQANPEEIQKAAATMPFLAPRRLVLFNNPLVKVKDKTAQERFLQMLDHLPPSALVVLIIEDHRRRKKAGNDWILSWETLKKDSREGKKHWLVEWAEKSEGRAKILEAPLPDINEMPGWILKKAVELKGKFTPEAAQALADQIENDTRLAQQEITKLLTYVDFKRPVEDRDVGLLTSGQSQVSIFDLVDQMSQGSTQKAVGLLDRLLEQEEPEILFAMVIRQFRLLLQTREILDENGGSAQVAKEVSEVRFQFVAEKLVRQARRFTMGQLEAIYHHLLKMDEQMKTGQAPAGLLLELFVSSLK